MGTAKVGLSAAGASSGETTASLGPVGASAPGRASASAEATHATPDPIGTADDAIDATERQDPDLDIVRLAQRRSTRSAAMGVLYERFRDRVFNVALRIVSHREEASDVLQDVFVLLFRKIHRFRANASFASWVYRITVNVALDRLRRRRRSPAATSTAAILDGAPPVRAHEMTPPEHRLAARELEQHVRAALDSLSPRLRIVIVLRYMEGFAYAEVAEILDCSVGTVKSRLNRAHGALKRELASRYGTGLRGVLPA